MSTSPNDFRCAAASLAVEEPMPGSAPSDVAWLFVEYAGAWGRQAVADSRLPEEVREFLAGLDGIRVQLIRRHGGVSGPGVRVFAAHLGAEVRVWTTVLDDARDLLDLDVAALAAGADPGLTSYDDPLWLVCTNGRRDVCCAEIGRPIAAALAAAWPDATWETTHLGGHRFSGTLLALPSGVVLGRLDVASAVRACAELENGRLEVGLARGRAGLSGASQTAELWVRGELGIERLDEARVLGVDGSVVTVAAAGSSYAVEVAQSLGEPRRQSCADLKTKPAAIHEVVSWAPRTD